MLCHCLDFILVGVLTFSSNELLLDAKFINIPFSVFFQCGWLVLKEPSGVSFWIIFRQGALDGTWIYLDLLYRNWWLRNSPVNVGVFGEKKLRMLLCLNRFINIHFF
jgi:hypothetical protein